MATHDRKRATIELDLYPSKALDISLSYFTTEDDYDDSLIGFRQRNPLPGFENGAGDALHTGILSC